MYITWRHLLNISPNAFDVTMGSFAGAEICELFGLFILSTILKRNLKRTYLILLLISYFTILLLVLYIVSFYRCNGA